MPHGFFLTMKWPLFWETALTADLHESSATLCPQGFLVTSEMNMNVDLEEFCLPGYHAMWFVES
jgi:hypothetical protein